MQSNKVLLAIIAAFSLLIFVLGAILIRNNQVSQINSFAECAAAGYPIMTSYPEQCATPDGRTFTNNVGQTVTYIGELVCLPHKDTSGAVTLECAYGLKTADGKHHGLKSTDTALYDFSTSDTLKITGTITNEEASIYDIVDTVSVNRVEKL